MPETAAAAILPEQSARDTAVRELYERFPYPPPLEDLTPFRERTKRPTWNPRDSFALYFPQEPKRAELDILIAGCGTRLTQMMASYMPEARFVAIDICEASLALAKAQCIDNGIDNVTFHRLALEDAPSLGLDFDIVHCHGVLHHLADPVLGLRRLAAVTRPAGTLNIMVYAKYGRTGVYMLQELAKRLGLEVTGDDAAALKALLRQLPTGHPLSMLPYGDQPDVPVEEIVDMLLHPRDVAYTIDDLRGLVDGAGLKLHRFLGHAQYEPEVSALGAVGLGQRLGSADVWERAAALELLNGKLIMHALLLTHPHRASAAEIFEGAAIVDAIPHLSPHMSAASDGEQLVLRNHALQVDIDVRAPTRWLAPYLKAVDGQRSVGEITWLANAGRVDGNVMQAALGLFRQLYLADIIELQAGAAAITPT